jgi:hypothetical protein
MGSAFSGYIANCLKQWQPAHISAFATLGSGLKIKGDGYSLPTNWGECEGCQYFPFAPVKFTDSLGLKACVFTNTGDGHFHKTDMQLAKRWSELGNPVETNVKPGGHCNNRNMPEIVKCLGIGDSPRTTAMPNPPKTGTTSTTTTTTTATTTTTSNAAALTIRDVGGAGCLKSAGAKRLLQKSASSDCASFVVIGQQFNSMDIEGQCLDFFDGRGWGLWTCHGGDNQKLKQHGSKWCSRRNCVEKSAPTSTLPPTTSTLTTTATATTTLPISSASIRSGDTVFLKARSGNGKHIHVQGLEVQAVWESRGNSQAIEIEKKSGGILYSGDVVYLKSHTGAHIDVVDGAVQARWTDRGSWQAMTIQKRIGHGAILADDIVCLRAHTGKNLDVEDSVVRARWEECGDWQALKIEREVVGALFSGDSVHLLAHTGNRIEVEGSSVAARWTEMGVWQTFTIQSYGGRALFSGDSVFVQAHTQKLLHVEWDAVVRADWSAWGEWQRLIIERKHGNGPVMPGDAVFLRVHTGNFIDVEGVKVQARFQDRGLWQSIVVEKSLTRRLTKASTDGALAHSGETEEEKDSEFFFLI